MTRSEFDGTCGGGVCGNRKTGWMRYEINVERDKVGEFPVMCATHFEFCINFVV